ncbi:MAG: 23S rRNA (pseudouridine(1915)-N(3))-methyltransferase RlmH [Myxococcota bacterium]
MKVVVHSFRGKAAPWADAACDEWAKRIRRHAPFEEIFAKPGTAAEDAARLFATLPARARLVALDERGEDLTSEQFAGLVDAAARESAASLFFAIGGPYGHDASVRTKAWRVVRLSRLVLAHAVARVVLVEQIYRAFAIRSGEPYHHS